MPYEVLQARFVILSITKLQGQWEEMAWEEKVIWGENFFFLMANIKKGTKKQSGAINANKLNGSREENKHPQHYKHINFTHTRTLKSPFKWVSKQTSLQPDLAISNV